MFSLAMFGELNNKFYYSPWIIVLLSFDIDSLIQGLINTYNGGARDCQGLEMYEILAVQLQYTRNIGIMLLTNTL
jgi:hypothetical protein